MSNSVLVFEENKAIQGLIASTISDQVELWQESRPDAFLQLADRLFSQPDLHQQR
jgi:hypothetical protein